MPKDKATRGALGVGDAQGRVSDNGKSMDAFSVQAL